MRFFRKRLVGLFAATALVTGIVVPVTASPAWAVGCFADSCTGKDPISMGCANDAVTIYTKTGVGNWSEGILQLRYSRNCAAAWAKVYDDGSLNNDIAWVSNTQGWTFTRPVDNGGGDAYTDMVDDLGTIQSKACIGHSGSNSSTCTSWF